MIRNAGSIDNKETKEITCTIPERQPEGFSPPPRRCTVTEAV